MEARIQFRVDEETKQLAQSATQRSGDTLSNACRKFTQSLAQKQKEFEANEEWLTTEINKAYEKMEAGKSKFYSSNDAEEIISLRKKNKKAQMLATSNKMQK